MEQRRIECFFNVRRIAKQSENNIISCMYAENDDDWNYTIGRNTFFLIGKVIFYRFTVKDI